MNFFTYKKVALIVFSIALTILALELCLRIVYPSQFQSFIDHTTETWADPKNVSVFKPSKTLGYEPLPNLDLPKIFKSNSLGMLDKKRYRYKPKDTYRILCIGDSTTAHSDYVDILENALNENRGIKRFEVWNCGVTGYNTMQSCRALKEKWLKYKPDMVILGFCLNDFISTPLVLREGNTLVSYHPHKEIMPMVSPFLLRHSNLYRFIISGLFFSKNNEYYKEIVKATNSYLQETKDVLDKNDIHFLVTIFGLTKRFEDWKPAWKKRYADIKKISEEHNINTLDMVPIFQDNRPKDLMASDELHFNNKGSRLVALAIHDYLKQVLKINLADTEELVRGKYNELARIYQEYMSLEDEVFKKLTFTLDDSGPEKGARPKFYMRDQLGRKWLLRLEIPEIGTSSIAAYHLYNLLGLETPETHSISLKINGKILKGDMQRFIDNKGTLGFTVPKDLTLNALDYLLKTHVIAWLVSDDDPSENNFLVTSINDNKIDEIMRIDNDATFLTLDQRKLGHEPKYSYYADLWDFFKSKDIELGLESNFEFINFVTGLPDGFFEGIILPIYYTHDERGMIDLATIDLLINRKHNLPYDFRHFYNSLIKEKGETLILPVDIDPMKILDIGRDLCERHKIKIAELKEIDRKVQKKSTKQEEIKMMFSQKSFRILREVYMFYWKRERVNDFFPYDKNISLVEFCDKALSLLVDLRLLADNELERLAIESYISEIEKIKINGRPSYDISELNKVIEGSLIKGFNIAIFKDEGFLSISVPDSLSPAWFHDSLSKNYSVTYLDSAQMSSLKPGDFDLLIMPYGEAFPRNAFYNIRQYLFEGGGLLNIAGRPFWIPMVKVEDRWERLDIDDPYKEFLAPLGIKYYETTENDDIGLSVVTSISFNPVEPTHGNVFPYRIPSRDFYFLDHTPGVFVKSWRNPYLKESRNIPGKWCLLGARGEDHPLDPKNPDARELLIKTVEHLSYPLVIYSLESDFASYRQGERASVTLKVINNGRFKDEGTVEFEFIDKDEKIVYSKIKSIELDPGQEMVLNEEWKPKEFKSRFYKVRAILKKNGTIFDKEENGFVVFDKAVLSKGPVMRIKGRGFIIDEKESLILGTNYYESKLGELMWIRPNLSRIRDDFKAMKDAGINFVRIHYHHSNWFRDYFSQVAKEDLDPYLASADTAALPSERSLRILDAVIQLAQEQGLIFCMDIFTLVPEEMGNPIGWLSLKERIVDKDKVETQKQFIRVLAKRYRDVPGITWDLWNEPRLDKSDYELLRNWIAEIRRALSRNGDKHLVTIGGNLSVDFLDVLDYACVQTYEPGDFEIIDNATKPVIFNETWNPAGHSLEEEIRQAEELKKDFNAFLDTGFAGFAPWQWTRQARLWNNASEPEKWDDELGLCVREDGTLKPAGEIYSSLINSNK